jgi:hypothetical protein
MGNQIYFKIAGYVDLDVLIIFTPCQIFDITNGFWDITKNMQFYLSSLPLLVLSTTECMKEAGHFTCCFDHVLWNISFKFY